VRLGRGPDSMIMSGMRPETGRFLLSIMELTRRAPFSPHDLENPAGSESTPAEIATFVREGAAWVHKGRRGQVAAGDESVGLEHPVVDADGDAVDTSVRVARSTMTWPGYPSVRLDLDM
jgi:hypothetical protein